MSKEGPETVRPIQEHLREVFAGGELPSEVFGSRSVCCALCAQTRCGACIGDSEFMLKAELEQDADMYEQEIGKQIVAHLEQVAAVRSDRVYALAIAHGAKCTCKPRKD